MQAYDAAGAPPHLRTLRRRGELPADTVVALGMHGTRRYGRAVPKRLVRARPGHGPARGERRTEAQRAANRMWVTLDAVRAVPGGSVEVAFSSVCGHASAVRAHGGGVRPALPTSCKFLTAGVVGGLKGAGIRRITPCPNKPRVAASLRGFAARQRACVSSPRIR